jgi:[ribosomal protein S5]-alanine N-acetyltransferase
VWMTPNHAVGHEPTTARDDQSEKAGSKAGSIMRIQMTCAEIRSWQETDAESLATNANNRKIWRNLRDAFPHPYSAAEASAFIRSALTQIPETRFAIVVDGQAVGGIGFMLHDDVERVSAEIGYWLGEPFWGRGIMTEAVQAATKYAVQTHRLTRVFAVPFEWNHASFRVLEKAGYTLEARLRRSAIKDHQVIDQLLYAYVVSDIDP